MIKHLLSYLQRGGDALPNQPTHADSIRPYPIEFDCAVRFSAKFARTRARHFLEESEGDAQGLMKKILSAMSASGLAAADFDGAVAQCLKWSHFFAPFISDATGLNAWPTLGQLWKGEKKVFGPSWSDLSRWCEQGLHLEDLVSSGSDGLNWHAWITLETGEIIDLTLPSTLACVVPHKFGQLAGDVLIGQESAIFDGHRYYPMLVGSEVIEAMHAKSSVPFLARSKEDLMIHPVFLVRTGE